MVPLYKPYMPNNLPEINNILHSGELSYAKWGKKFEKKLGEYIGNPNIIVVNSYNSAMIVLLTTLGIKKGDEVIASPMSCLASNQPFATIGAKVVWADIDPNLGTLNPESVKQKITSNTKAIFHNHFCGYPGYIEEINEIGKEYGVYVVDDAIEAFGSRYKNNIIGKTGSDSTVFSFQTVRLPNTIDGGAVCFRDNDLFEKAKRVRDLGINREHFRDKYGEISKDYDINEPGYSATLSEINSYIGFVQMESIDELINKQVQNSHAWKCLISRKNIKAKELHMSFQKPNFWIFGILVPNKLEFLLESRSKGFYVSSVHLPNNNYSIFGNKGNLKGVDEFFSKFLALPSGWWVNYNDIINF